MYARFLATCSVSSRPSVTFSLAQPSLAVLVLSQIDTRYFEAVSGAFAWTVEFVLYKQGDKTPLGRSQHTGFWMRSVNLEMELETGDYVVHVCFIPAVMR